MRPPPGDSWSAHSMRGSIVRILAGGLGAALLVLAGGALLQRMLLGTDRATAHDRLRAEITTTFDRTARLLQRLSLDTTSPAAARRSRGGEAERRTLFEMAEAAVAASGESGVAVTVYSAQGVPLAWAGLPSDLPRERITSSESWFLAEGSLGLRLFYVAPVPQGSGGAVVAEWVVPAAEPPARLTDTATGDSYFRMTTRLAPVVLQASDDRTPAPGGSIAVHASTPAGRPLLRAHYLERDIDATRERWHRATVWYASLCVAAAALAALSRLVSAARRRADFAAAALLLAFGRAVVDLSPPSSWSTAPVFSGAAYASPLAGAWLASPIDFLLSALTVAGFVALALAASESSRLWRWRRRAPVTTSNRVSYLLHQFAAGVTVAALLVGHEAFIADTIGHSSLDLLRYSLLHWDTARMALQTGLIVAHVAAIGGAVFALRLASSRWRVGRREFVARAPTLAAWATPLLAWLVWRTTTGDWALPLLLPLVVAIAAARTLPSLITFHRHGTPAVRVLVLAIGVVAPACACYPLLFNVAKSARLALVETRYAPQAISQRETVQQQLDQSLDQIDAIPDLGRLVDATQRPEAATDRAFDVWQATALSTFPATSSVELYADDGTLVSRFAFNLPEDLAATPLSDENSCAWEIYEEVAPFFGEERRVIHAGRAICTESGEPFGSVVVHAMPDDYENLPFLTSRSPYVELMRPSRPSRGEGLAERGVEYAVYGWSRTPIYTSTTTAWSLPDDVFARIEGGREPFWTELSHGETRHDVYVLNDRGGIYAIGVPVVPLLGHLMNLAELTVLASGVILALLLLYTIGRAIGERGLPAPALLAAVRSSFSRKLFLAFVAAVFFPVVALAVLTRNYVADQVRTTIEDEALRTAAAAGRLVENVLSPRGTQPGARIDDNLLVFVSRLIEQDVNIFTDGRLRATSERNLFASGFLPIRTPAAIERQIALGHAAAAVSHERIGALEYLVAATPIATRQFTGLLTLPLPSRQQEIDEQIDTLDRRVLLATVVFILLGAVVGRRFADNISDPVKRLSRVTRRIAKGDLSARTIASSTDELGRLVDDFNSMASELQRQRAALERTHRIEAWAEMARQVAHEIKNPLTPIQLNAEHLRRVHADRGAPLGPVVQDCVSTILTQVRLLRQIASEFSSFASAPTARPAPVDLGVLVREVLTPYEMGLEPRIRFDVTILEGLPPAYVDRTLVARALTNLVENALHAMPADGTLRVRVETANDRLRITITDTGHGMDDEALARAFEPYFSTKTGGTGLGLPLARRNVELNGGTIAIRSERLQGTTVELTLPAARA